TSFLVLDRSHVSNSSNAPAAVLNAGTGETRLSYDAGAGGILSVGPVNLYDRATSGNITSHAAISVSSSASAGALRPFAPVSLPALATLPSFPAPAAGFTLDANTSRSPAPGSYGVVNVNSGGTLILASGDYYFDTLNIQATSTVRVTATTRVFVKNGFT